MTLPLKERSTVNTDIEEEIEPESTAPTLDKNPKPIGTEEREFPTPYIQNRLSLENENISHQRLSILYGSQITSKIGQRASFVRLDREKIDKKHRQFHTHSIAKGLEQKENTLEQSNPSRKMRRGVSVLGRSDSIRREVSISPEKKHSWKRNLPKPWVCCSRTLTCCILGCCLKKCGMKSPDIQQAWREKVTLCVIIVFIILSVAFLTFGFNELICGFPPVQYHVSEIGGSKGIIDGKVYNLDGFQHPAIPEGSFVSHSPLSSMESMNGKDLSFLFQQEKGSCKEIIQAKSVFSPSPSRKTNSLFPCIPIENNAFNGTILVNPTANPSGRGCHQTTQYLTNCLAQAFIGEVFYYWSDIQMTNSSLVVYDGNVLDLDRLRWISPLDFNLPADMLELISTNPQMGGKDITFFLNRNPKLGRCLLDTIKVGVVDSKTIGCILADILLILSLMAIVAIVLIRFLLAVYFGWVVSWRMGAVANESFEQRRKREKELEMWADTNDIRISSGKKEAMRKKSLFRSIPQVSRYTVPLPGAEPGRKPKTKRKNHIKQNNNENLVSYHLSSDAVEPNQPEQEEMHHTSASSTLGPNPISVKKSDQDEPEYPLINFDPLHCILLVTCYSEGKEGLRTTLESLATTHYPVSHKLILVIADGQITGAGNEMSTPDICLTMLGDEIVPFPDVQAYSYVAIADGQKRHNTAKIYAGFYKYEHGASKGIKVPMIVIIKWGTPEESNSSKPGNRGKRDSQIMLMSFFQKVMFDERMSPFEYELFNMVWKTCGISPDKYELLMMVGIFIGFAFILLCFIDNLLQVDADTKVHKDSLTHMAACMAREDLVMGCCGETKIANKNDSWVTMMQG
ncbi:Chitin synthase, class 3 [Basidiobolus ranarum]|uniref:Chitin synthase, class 3 n=1 Tax=Basidiobolus ranarum TaxID=34480 RepID=A0ABR2WKL2_9FUNG